MDAPRTWSRVAAFLAALSMVCVVGSALLITVGGSPRSDLAAVPDEAETAAAVAAGVEDSISSAHDALAEMARTIAPDPDSAEALDRALEAHPEFLGLTIRDAADQVTATAGTVLPGDLGSPGYTSVTVQSDPQRVTIPLESGPHQGWTVVGALDSGALIDGPHGDGDILARALPPDADHDVWVVGADGAVITGTDDSPRLVTLSTRARREAGIQGLAGQTSAQLARNGDGEEIVAQAPIRSNRRIGVDLAVVTARSPVMAGTVRDGGLVLEVLTYGAGAVALGAASSIIRRSEGSSALPARSSIADRATDGGVDRGGASTEADGDDIVADHGRPDASQPVVREHSDA